MKSSIEVEEIKNTFLPGTRVHLISMDDVQAPPFGAEGTVRGVDDIGSIMINWDDGSRLNVILTKTILKFWASDEIYTDNSLEHISCFKKRLFYDNLTPY